MNLERLLNPIKRKLFLLIGKAILTKVNNVGKTGFHDSGTRANPQRVDMNWFGQLTDIERSQPYGFETYPVADTAKCILLSPDGSRSNTFVIMVQDDEYRPTDLSEGDTCLYGKNDKTEGEKHRIQFKADGSIEIWVGKTNKIIIAKDGTGTVEFADDLNVTVPNMNITGNLNVTGDVAVVGDQTNDGTIAATGNITTDADVLAAAISLINHFHQGNLGFPTGSSLAAGGGTAPGSLPTASASGEITDGLGTKSTNHVHSSPAGGNTGTAV